MTASRRVETYVSHLAGHPNPHPCAAKTRRPFRSQLDIPPDKKTEAMLRHELAIAYRAAAQEKMNEGVCNHFTVALPGNEYILVISHGTPWEHCSASDLLLVRARDGAVVYGDPGTLEETAFFIHKSVHLALGEARAKCVLHTHMPWATALCCLRPDWAASRVMQVHQNSCKFFERVAYDDQYGGLAQDSTEGERMCAPLLRRPRSRVLFLTNHGVMVVGASVAEAWNDLYYLERACRTQVLALQAAGGDLAKLHIIGDVVARRTRDQQEHDGKVGHYAKQWFAALEQVLAAKKDCPPVTQ